MPRMSRSFLIPYALSMPGLVTSMDVAPPRRIENSGMRVSRTALIFFRLAKISVPLHFLVQRGLLTQRGVSYLASSILNCLSPRFIDSEASSLNGFAQRTNDLLFLISSEVLCIEFFPCSGELKELRSTGGKNRELCQEVILRKIGEHLFFKLKPRAP